MRCKQHSIKSSIKTDPIVIANQLGFNAIRIVHTHYNPTMGWEIAIEEQQKTQIIICDEKNDTCKVFY